jgi:hypothetical protein
MFVLGHVENGVVVFDTGVSLPEGTKVSIAPVVDSPAGTQASTGDWEVAMKAAQELRESGYDLDAWQRLREYDRQHAADHLP